MDDNVVRRQAREKLKSGALPRQPQQKLWVGPSDGFRCTLCDRPIDRDDMEYEVELPPSVSVQTMRFHRRCHAIWERECARFRGRRSSPR